jgi:hypothetical protein
MAERLLGALLIARWLRKRCAKGSRKRTRCVRSESPERSRTGGAKRDRLHGGQAGGGDRPGNVRQLATQPLKGWMLPAVLGEFADDDP